MIAIFPFRIALKRVWGVREAARDKKTVVASLVELLVLDQGRSWRDEKHLKNDPSHSVQDCCEGPPCHEGGSEGLRGCRDMF